MRLEAISQDDTASSVFRAVVNLGRDDHLRKGTGDRIALSSFANISARDARTGMSDASALKPALLVHASAGRQKGAPTLPLS